MQTKPLEPGVEITSALTLDELEEVKARGFHTVVCNRIEGESEDFPDEARYREKAEQLGLAWVHIPVKPGEYSEADIRAFAEALQQLPRPLLAFCRSGKRATHCGPTPSVSTSSAIWRSCLRRPMRQGLTWKISAMALNEAPNKKRRRVKP